jgi:hypothetical protein
VSRGNTNIDLIEPRKLTLRTCKGDLCRIAANPQGEVSRLSKLTDPGTKKGEIELI